MGFKTIVFDGYLTITQMGDAEDAVDFSSYALEAVDTNGDGFHVQRFISKQSALGNVVRYDVDSKRIWEEAKTQEASEKIKAARLAHPYLIEKNRQAKLNFPYAPLTETSLKYSEDFGASMNFYCLRGGSYRQAKSSVDLLSQMTAEYCDICGGQHDSFERFYASVSRCWRTKIWEGPVWNLIGSRSDVIEFPATPNQAFPLVLSEHFLMPRSKIMDIRLGNNGPNREGVEADDYMKNGGFCVMPEGSKDRLNAGQSTVVVHCLPFPDGTGEIEGCYHLSTRWLPETRVQENYPIFLALEAFSENRLGLACTMAFASFESSVNKLEKKTKDLLDDQVFSELTEKYNAEKNVKKGYQKSHRVSLLNVLLEYHGIAKIESFAKSFPEKAKELSIARQFVHEPDPTDMSRQQVYELVCAGIYGTRLCSAISELFDEGTKREFQQKRALVSQCHSLRPSNAEVCSSKDNDKALKTLEAKVSVDET